MSVCGRLQVVLSNCCDGLIPWETVVQWQAVMLYVIYVWGVNPLVICHMARAVLLMCHMARAALFLVMCVNLR